MYARIVVDVRPEKEEPKWTHITAGGDQLEYFGDIIEPRDSESAV